MTKINVLCHAVQKFTPYYKIYQYTDELCELNMPDCPAN